MLSYALTDARKIRCVGVLRNEGSWGEKWRRTERGEKGNFVNDLAKLCECSALLQSGRLTAGAAVYRSVVVRGVVLVVAAIVVVGWVLVGLPVPSSSLLPPLPVENAWQAGSSWPWCYDLHLQHSIGESSPVRWVACIYPFRTRTNVCTFSSLSTSHR